MASADVAMSSSAIARSNNPPKTLRNLFVPPPPDKCTRCGNRVYQVEKVGPVNEVIFHKQCFKCCQCGQHLSLKTYFTNQDDFSDREIYCSKHCPKVSAHGYDARAMGIRSAMAATRNVRLNEQIRGTGETPRIDADAMGIRQPMEAQSRYQRKYITAYDKHHFPAYLVSRTKEKLYEYQEELERQHREEEDRLMAQFHQERLEEAENMQKEFENEWEQQLKVLTDQFDGAQKKKDKTLASTERLEEAKAELKKTMTVKMMKKKEAATLRLQHQAQQKTSSLVKKHSEEMLQLLQSKQEELAKELEEEIKNAPEIEDQEEFLEVAKAALMLPSELPEAHPPRGRKRDLYHHPDVFKELDEDVFMVAETEQSTFTDLVKQLTANCISDLQKARAIFRWITVKDLNVMEFDESVKQDTPLGLLRGIKFGTETYHTLFMRLCSYAGLPCKEVSGHAKSVGYEPGMKIPEDKFTNTWNVVLILGDWWPVQCNWGARHLVLNKDLQDKNPTPVKQDRDKIRYQYDEHYFLTDPDEFSQEFHANDPEWQLLENPISLEEFEALPFVRSVFFHYGLEFTEPTKAVLHTDSKGGAEVKINVPEELGDDIIFHYQLCFAARERRSHTDFRGVKLDRFVYHSMCDGCALFSVHVPTPGEYYLEIFANKINESNKLSDDPNAQLAPFRLKCACKFRVVCKELTGKMHPLPNCASGEWGPTKARRHFGLEPLSHTSGLINMETVVELRLRQPRPLEYVFRLRFNEYDDALLKRFVTHEFNGDIVSIRVTPPHVGQYGLDVFAQPQKAAHKSVVAHVCKYLLNCTFVASPVDVLASNGATTSPVGSDQTDSRTSSESTPSTAVVPGPRPAFNELGLKTLSHPDPIVQKLGKSGAVAIEIGHPETVIVTGRLTRSTGIQQDLKVVEKTKGKKTNFAIKLPSEGTYSFALFAAQRNDMSHSANVYNYVIEHREEDPKKKRK